MDIKLSPHGGLLLFRPFDTSGSSGAHGTRGREGRFGGGRGYDGGSGCNGSHARDLSVSLSADSTGCVFVKANDQRDLFPLSERNIAISLKARGGNGGNGGNGGAGGKGSPGRSGEHATNYSWGSDGGRGGTGGRGGYGGRGGNGGNGGRITLHVNTEDTDLLMLTPHSDVSGGTKGRGGKGGSGGSGGNGGRGGRSYSWTTVAYRKTSNYSGHSQIQPYTESHRNPGGLDGPSGRSGVAGKRGCDGKNGQDGTFTIVTDQETYKGPYDLSVVSCKLTDSNHDNIFEPGETVSARLTVRNTGKMPTPEKQTVRLWLRDNCLVHFDPRSTQNLPTGLPAGHTFTPPFPLVFRITDAPVQTGPPLKSTGTVDYRATVARIEREFSNVAGQSRDFPIRYPVELKPIEGISVISPHEEALLSVKVQNISSRELGIEGEQGRLVNLKYKVAENSEITASDITLLDKEGNKLSGDAGLFKSIRSLGPAKQDSLSGSLKFTNPGLKPYSKVTVTAQLQLGNLESPGDTQQIKTIQQRTFEIQLAETFRANPGTDFLLVTNGNTALTEMQAWQRLAGQLGLQFATWNSTLYNGISLHHSPEPRPAGGDQINTGTTATETPSSAVLPPETQSTDKQQLLHHFMGKTVVFLNYPDPGGKIATDTLPGSELFHSASEHFNISTYVLGQPVADIDQFYPDKATLDSIPPTTSFEHYFFRKDTSKTNLKKFAEQHAEKLRLENPQKRFTVVYEYDLKKLPNRRFRQKRYQLGRLKTCPAPRENRFVYLNVNSSAGRQSSCITSQENVYRLLKSLPLSRKISLIDGADRRYRVALKRAILSDLVDEHKTFSRDQWTGRWDKKRLKSELTCLQQVVDCKYSDESLPWIQNLLLEFRAFADRMPSRIDRLLINRRQDLLTATTKELLDSFFNSESHDTSWKESYCELKNNIRTVQREQLWKHYQSPADSIMPLYRLHGKNRVIDKKDLDTAYRHPRTSTVVERSHGFRNQAQRLQALEILENGKKD